MKEIKIEELSINPMNMFGKDWALVTAGNQADGYNGMTIAWGHMGCIFDRHTNHGKKMIPTINVYIRPQRYTKQFIDHEELFTVSFFDSNYKRALGYMGSHSGQNEDKIEKAGLTPLFIDDTTSYQEARMVFVCKKIYHSRLLEEGFESQEIIDQNYPKKDYHEMYMGEILKAYIQ